MKRIRLNGCLIASESHFHSGFLLMQYQMEAHHYVDIATALPQTTPSQGFMQFNCYIIAQVIKFVKNYKSANLHKKTG